MTITLTLTPEEELLLREKAALSGQTPAEVLVAPLRATVAVREWHGATDPAPPLDPVLAELIAAAEQLDPKPGPRLRGQEAEIEDLIAAKFRKQGMNI